MLHTMNKKEGDREDERKANWHPFHSLNDYAIYRDRCMVENAENEAKKGRETRCHH